MPGKQAVDHGAQAVEIATRRDRSAGRLLGRHVVGRTDDTAGHRHLRGAEQLGDAEVQELDLILASQQQVGGFQVAMHDSPVVRVLQGGANLHCQTGDFAPVKATPGDEFLLQVSSLHKLHRIEQLTFLFSESEHLDNVGVVELLQRLDFRHKPFAKVDVVDQCGRQHLDGHTQVGLFINALVDRAHAPASQKLLNAVRAKVFRVHGGRGS